MPRELSPAEERAFARYEALGTPEELQKQAKDLETAKSEAADRRQKVKALEDELATAKAAVPEGGKVLSAEEAKAWERYAALGTPEEAEKLKTERDELAGKVAAQEREAAFAKVAKLSGLHEDAVPAMLDLRSLDGAVWEFKPAKAKGKDGKEVDTEEVFVTLAGEGQKQQKFAELSATSPQLKGLPKADASTTLTGIPAPEQRGGGGDKGIPAGGIDEMIAKNAADAKAGNPLKPAKAA